MEEYKFKIFYNIIIRTIRVLIKMMKQKGLTSGLSHIVLQLSHTLSFSTTKHSLLICSEALRSLSFTLIRLFRLWVLNGFVDGQDKAARFSSGFQSILFDYGWFPYKSFVRVFHIIVDTIYAE